MPCNSAVLYLDTNFNTVLMLGRKSCGNAVEDLDAV